MVHTDCAPSGFSPFSDFLMVVDDLSHFSDLLGCLFTLFAPVSELEEVMREIRVLYPNYLIAGLL